ncbi:MAG: hypothetical protein AB7K52_12270 [Phycisphaerales bacterium]
MPTYVVQCVDRRDGRLYRVTVEAGGSIEAVEVAAAQGHVCSHAVSLASLAVPTRPEADIPGAAPPRESALPPPTFPPVPEPTPAPGSTEDRLERIEAHFRRVVVLAESIESKLSDFDLRQSPISTIGCGVVAGLFFWSLALGLLSLFMIVIFGRAPN